VRERRFDLVVRNGTVVTPGRRERADVGITGGRIAQLGGTMAGARAGAAVDWSLHPVLTGLGDAELTEAAALAADGHTSIKVFLSDPGFRGRHPRPGRGHRRRRCH
jgi:hypothetical protein